MRAYSIAVEAGSGAEPGAWLVAIGNLSSAVNAGLGLRPLLDLVAATARKLLALDSCAVMIPAPGGESLAIGGASGVPVEYTDSVNRSHLIRLEKDASVGGPASRAFRSGEPWAVADLAAEPPSNWTRLGREQGYRSVLAVPLITGAGVIGTLNSYHNVAHEFLPYEVEQLELLAKHAATALTSARIMEDLREQHRIVVRSEEIHDRLVRVAVRSGGVGGITTALHDLLGCEVIVRDASGETLAATAHAAVAAPHSAGFASAPTRAQGGGDLVREDGPNVAVAVILDGDVVATVWLLGQAGKLDLLGVRAAEHASVALSLELLRSRTAIEVEQTLRGELLADLLAGADPDAPSLRNRASLMGHDLGVRHRMLVAEVHDTAGTGAPAGTSRPCRSKEAMAQRAASDAVRLTRHLHPRPLIASARELVVALWPVSIDDPTGPDLLRRAVTVAGQGVTVRVVMSEPDSDGFPTAYRVARGALSFTAANGKTTGVLALDDLGVAGLLLQTVEPAVLHRYAERTLGAVSRYDADHGAELLKTARAYLDCDLDRYATSKRLVLHPNTVSQRLRRIETLTGLSFRSPRSAIDIRTALMLADVAGAEGELTI